MREARAALAVAIGVVMGVRGVQEIRTAAACGCLSPPAVTAGDFAVNQEAEQIIFETEPGWVTAHVLIKYAGAPEKFAWIVPVPDAPELGVSPVSTFGLLDKLTAPDVAVQVEDICPTSAWSCNYFDPTCGTRGVDDGFGGALADAGATPGGSDPGVTVLDQKVVGDYQTVTFRANEAGAATQWLRDNGFIVNQTTSIYMEPYVQANMVFVAIKLVPGAGISAIKPLRLRYRSAFPMVPLVLTAVAAEPHLTVTSFIYGDKPFRPMGHPIVTLDGARLAQDPRGRLNYPMLLARTIDEAGGDGFAIEYRGGSVRPTFGNSCCGDAFDRCSIGGDGQCQCPGDAFDQTDCADQGDLLDGVALLDALATAHPTLTRITTRVSPEEMTFDPQFEIDYGAALSGRLTLRATQPSLARCRPSVIDQPKLAEVDALQGCAAVYCGLGAHCVTTAAGAGCDCGDGTVAQQFIDLDGKPSVTCVPQTPTCDLRAGGDPLPDACAGVDCGAGKCHDRNGIPVCACDAGAGAVAGIATAPRCSPIQRSSQTPGAQDFSEGLRALDVCAPPPPTCGDNGYLVHTGTSRPGVACGVVDPPLIDQVPWNKPDCGAFGCGGCDGARGPLSSVIVVWIALGLVLLRRRA